MSENKIDKPPFMLATDVFLTGKHKGEQLKEVAATDPYFVVWSVGKRQFRTTSKILEEANASIRAMEEEEDALMDEEDKNGNY